MLTGEMIQDLLSLYRDPRYLEIGVFKGGTFVPIVASEKVGVDPNFLFDVDAVLREQKSTRLHAVTSDEYFGSIVGPEERFDVIFLDGLHTVEQTLRDFNNAVLYLKPDGVILIDDVIPSSWAASLKTMDECYRAKNASGDNRDGGNWMGDVFRLVFFLDTFFQQFTFRTLAENHGQLIGWRSRRAGVRDRELEAISRLTYENVLLERDVYRVTAFSEVRAEIKALRSAQARTSVSR